MERLTQEQVGSAIKGFGNYRTRRTQTVANLGPPDGISGATLIALGLRETKLKNINGGAVRGDGGQWVEAPPEEQDGGCFQISRVHHAAQLKRMLAVVAGTWTPVIDGKTAFDPGCCPRFEDSLQFTLLEMHEAIAYAEDSGVPDDIWPRFAIAAHNGGKGGALKGYREGDIDRYTAMGDYSAWVQYHRTLVNRWLNDHDNWKVAA